MTRASCVPIEQVQRSVRNRKGGEEEEDIYRNGCFCNILFACLWPCYSDQQRLLNRTESQVERCYDNFQECHALVERCTSELQKLREEKKLLMDRLAAIETDISKVCPLCVAFDSSVCLLYRFHLLRNSIATNGN